MLGPRKFGGNAQAITGRRWLHHTSLLWDYEPDRMALLAQPAKQPQYREVGVAGCGVVWVRQGAGGRRHAPYGEGADGGK